MCVMCGEQIVIAAVATAPGWLLLCRRIINRLRIR